MRNIQVFVEYDGTAYCGWQKQINGISIQEKLMESIYAVTKEMAKITGSGRTDAGVHAWEQSANFYTESKIPVNRIPLALNSHLPKDIRIVGAAEKDEAFHSRYHAKGKVYEYIVLNRPYASALDRNRSWHVREKLDIDKIEKAMTFFIGAYDFTTFSSVKSQVRDKVRNVTGFEVTRDGFALCFRIEGDGFLYNMVRIIIGTLIEVGRGRIDAERIPDMIKGKNRALSGPTAPPQGLYLKKVIY
jgi:tRNA pseudouridine38-40 synthase